MEPDDRPDIDSMLSHPFLNQAATYKEKWTKEYQELTAGSGVGADENSMQPEAAANKE